MMLKRLLAAVVAMLMAAQPMMVRAADLEGAFSRLLGSQAALSVNQPGHYQSAARHTFVAGGLDVRFPRTSNVSLLSITPPSFSAGCNGISAHFGGFSFISGQQIQQLMTTIAQGALGFAVSMAINALCPTCESVIREMLHNVQNATKFAMDSCTIANNIASRLLGDLGGNAAGSGESHQKFCAATSTDQGDSSDFLAALNNACNTVRGSLSWVTDKMKTMSGSTSGGTAQVALLNNGIGNQTWVVLNELIKDTGPDAKSQKLLLLSMLGTKIVSANAACGASGTSSGSGEEGDSSVPGLYCPRQLEPREGMALFMCGAPGAAKGGDLPPSAAVDKYCADWFNAGNNSGEYSSSSLTVWNCQDDDCLSMQAVPLNDAQANVISGAGFAYQVNALLRKGAQKIRNNEPFDDADSRRILALVQAAPYPLYQAINAAAVYPAAADDLLDTMSVLVAEMLAYDYFDQFLRLSGRTSMGTKVSAKHVETISKLLNELRAQADQMHSLIGQHLALQQGINEQIRQVNLAIQRQVLTQDMLNANRFALSAGMNGQSNINSSGSQQP